MTCSEVGNRLTRIVTAIALARTLGTIDFAAMSLVLTTYELVRMLIHNGVGARIVQAHDDELDAVCVAVNRINWMVGWAMWATQLAIAWPLQAFYDSHVAPMLAVLAFVHLIYPFGLIHGCLAQRREKIGFIAAMQFLQIAGDNLATAVLALLGCGAWAVIVPKVVIAVVCTLANIILVPAWRRVALPRPLFWQVVRYSAFVFGAEALNTMRVQGDRMIVGKALGMEAFAIYSFAANAGAGIATGLATALGQVALPFLSKGRVGDADMVSRFWLTVKGMLTVIAPVIFVQVVLAPWYVPVVFGARWTPAVPTLMLMCLATLARPVAVATSQLLRATGIVNFELRASQWSLAVFAFALLLGLPFGVNGVAVSLLIANVASALAIAWLALRLVAQRRGTQGRPIPILEASL